ncbi:MAG: hypothetical protein N3G79_06950, partial [Sulfolobales archaeon]|nr:hypothetical protein [Sulfolobales archaeon]
VRGSVEYLSEAEHVEDVLRIAYSRRVSKLTVLVNLSNSIPVLLSPDPDYVEVLSEGAVAFVWLDTENISVEYLVFEREPARLTVTPPTATPTETATREVTQPTETTPQRTTTPRPTGTPRSDAVSEATGIRERGWAVAAVAGLAVALAAIVILLKFAR